ncbi:MAG: class I SAM-dependent methyltransferase [Actinomycetota bacterium]|nr:class I SAM-dependent methyltransferase [Actinomycetota bacterium]
MNIEDPRVQSPADDSNARTLAVYEAHAEQYAELTESSGSIAHRTFLRRLARLAPPGEVLEVGSAQGRDAAYLEQHGRRVRRTDGTRAFVEMLRAQGHDADVVNLLTDDLADAEHGPYAAVLANAVFLHFTPDELALVLAKVASALVPGGVLGFSVKVGVGTQWSEHKLGVARFYQYWQGEPLLAFVEAAGLVDVDLELDVGDPWGWYFVVARAPIA